jgi:hypothetical protein
MKYVDVHTQEGLDAALKDPNVWPVLRGGGEFEISGSAQVRASGSAQVTASGSAQVTAYGSAQVRAYDSAQVTAYGSAQVRASDSAQVTAYDSAQVTASGSAQVTASKRVAVTRHGTEVKVEGGVQIEAWKAACLAEWLDEYGVEAKDGIVTLFKAVDSDFRSGRGQLYVPGTAPEAQDWDGGERECGGGFHFCGTPHHALGFFEGAKRFVGCPVRVDEIAFHLDAVYPSKVKARRVVEPGCFEVDIQGNRIGA